jgi:hypothetical protein
MAVRLKMFPEVPLVQRARLPRPCPARRLRLPILWLLLVQLGRLLLWVRLLREDLPGR